MFHVESADGELWSKPFPLNSPDPLLGVVNNPPAMVSLKVSKGPNRIEAFMLGTDNKLGTDRAMLWTFGTDSDPSSFSSWQSLGGTFPLGPVGPAVASWGQDRLDAFAIGLDFAMYHKWADGVIMHTNDWHPEYPKWESLGGSFQSEPAVASWGPNRLDVFALGLDNRVYRKFWNGAWNPALWQQVGTREFKSAPAVVSAGPKRLDLFALGLDDAMYHSWSNDGVDFQKWTPLGGNFLPSF